MELSSDKLLLKDDRDLKLMVYELKKYVVRYMENQKDDLSQDQQKILKLNLQKFLQSVIENLQAQTIIDSSHSYHSDIAVDPVDSALVDRIHNLTSEAIELESKVLQSRTGSLNKLREKMSAQISANDSELGSISAQLLPHPSASHHPNPVPVAELHQALHSLDLLQRELHDTKRDIQDELSAIRDLNDYVHNLSSSETQL